MRKIGRQYFKSGANVRLGVAVLDAGKRSGREAAEHRAALVTQGRFFCPGHRPLPREAPFVTVRTM